MRRTILSVAAGVLAAGVLCVGSPTPARANSVLFSNAFDPSTAFQVGNLDFWVTNCSLGGSAAACGSLELVAGAAGWNNVSVTIDSTAGHIINIPANNFPLINPSQYDLSFELNVATVGCVNSGFTNCPAVITSDALSITGSAPAGASNYDSDLTAAETISFPFGGSQVGPVTANAAQAQPTVASFAAKPALIATKDIGDNLASIIPGAPLTGPVTIDTITQNFGLVPEPATMGIFLVGLVALGASRRKRGNAISSK
jgi:hypothetical protein